MKRRILILLFALLFLLPSCAAGGGDGAPDDGASALTPDPGAIEAVEETEFDWYASLPEGTDFGGYTFTVVRYEDSTWNIYIAPEEMTGEVLNDAAYKRTLEAEDLINIQVEELCEGNYEGDFKNVVKAGESETYDL
ncbi:MAG: hypothetical protein IKZ41_07555, partial [Clostridia bacterium]|nr:hypothetical protein [Clostridia bacterium]